MEKQNSSSLLSSFIFVFFCLISLSSFAQNVQTISVDLAQNTQHREKIFSTSNQVNLDLCGLQVGQTYSLNYISSVADDGFLNQEADISKSLKFTAIDACHIFQLNIDSSIASIVSIVCDDCISSVSSSSLIENMMGIIGVPTVNADSLVEEVFIGGNCYETSNATIIGDSLSFGVFSGAVPIFGFDDGIILSTGRIMDIEGPSSNFSSTATGGNGEDDSDSNLESISTGNISDIAILEFDFVPTVDQVSFEYVFASEEYCEFAPPNASNVNDIFGFFLSGPGITDTINLAEVSEGVGVSINNVNPVTNEEFFNPNGLSNFDCDFGGESAELFAFDGYTDIFTAIANVIPCETYHIKLAIADSGDNIYDSAVFLKANRFEAGGGVLSSVTVPATNSNDAYESTFCGNAFFTFVRESGDLFSPATIEYTLGGTATNGVDYSGLPPSPIIIPPGLPDLTVPITIIADDISEGVETMVVYTTGQCNCENTETTLNIFDLPDLEVNVPDIEYCANIDTPAVLLAEVLGGIPPYFYDWGEGATPTPVLAVVPTESTSYTVTVTDFCGVEIIGVGNVNVTTVDAVLEGNATLCAGNENATLNINFSGTEGPFEIVYSIDGVLQNEITDIFDNPYTLDINQEGTYALEFVAVEGCIGEASGVVDVTGSSFQLNSSSINATCAGTNTGAIDLSVTNTNGAAVSYLWNNGSTAEDQNNLSAGNYSVTVNSGGCEIIESFVLTENEPLFLSVNVQQIDCSSSAMGAIDISASGGNGILSYNWSNGDTTEDLTGLAAGIYTLTITDSDNCELIETVTINEGGELLVDFSNSTVQDVSCAGYTNGSINLDIENSDNLSFIWSSNVGGQAGVIITDLAAGTYALTISNSANCSIQIDFEINEPSPLNLISIPTSPNCFAEATGSISLNANGGTPLADCEYIYQTDPILSSNNCGVFTEASAGSYEVSATDMNGCTLMQTVVIEGPLEMTINIELVNTSCQMSNDGVITVVASGGTTLTDCGYLFETIPPLSSTECGVFTNVSAGNYEINVTDANGCLVTQTIEIQNSGDISLNIETTNTLCAMSNAGTITAVASGGTPLTECGYIYQTVPALSTTDCGIFTEVPAGTYEVSATDANGCMFTQTVIIEEATEIIPIIETVNSSCAMSNDGTITVTATGGETFPDCAYLYTIEPELSSIDCGVFIDASAGLYTLTTEDALGCQIISTIEIIEPNALNVEIMTQDISCSGLADGIVTPIVTGGTAPYTGDEIIGDLSVGMYNLAITDAAGCELTVDYVINEPLVFSFSTVIENSSTSNSSDGNIFLENIIGGTAPYSFLWSTGATTEDLENISFGEYSLTITDAQDCEYSFTFEVDAAVAAQNIFSSGVEFFLYPNLIQSGNNPILFVRSPQADILDIQVISVSGKVLFEEQQNIGQGENELKIETRSLPLGIYFLRLSMGKDDFSVLKFICF